MGPHYLMRRVKTACYHLAAVLLLKTLHPCHRCFDAKSFIPCSNALRFKPLLVDTRIEVTPNLDTCRDQVQKFSLFFCDLSSAANLFWGGRPHKGRYPREELIATYAYLSDIAMLIIKEEHLVVFNT